MYRSCSIVLLFENNPKQSIDIAYGGDEETISIGCNEDPEDSYSGAYLTFTVDEFRDFIAACQEALDKKTGG
jgi:hypothetical protein